VNASWLRVVSKGVVFWSVFAIGSVVSAGAPKLTFQSLLLPRLPPFSNPSGIEDQWDEWYFQRIARAGRKEFLALFEHRVYRCDGWYDGGSKGEDGEKDADRWQDVTDALTLAIVNDRGMILYRASTPAKTVVKNPLNVGHAIPLVMDATNDCPYALLNAGAGTLLCYDHQLAFKMKREIPLEEIGYPKVTFDGERYSLWLFGNRFRKASKVTARGGKQDATTDRRGETSGQPKNEEGKKVSSFISRFDVAHDPAEALGVRYDVREDSWEPLPFSADELIDELDRIARGPKGERLQVQPASLHITPFRDLDTEEGFGVVIEGVVAKEYGNRALFSGTRLFFRSVMGRQGLGKITQLPLWLVQEDRRDVVLDEDSGVFRFPLFTQELDLQPFGFGKNDLALAFLWYSKVPQEDGKYGRGGRGRQVMLVFSGTDAPRILDLSPKALSEKIADDAFTMDELEVYPVRLVDRTGPSEFAFRTLCDNRRQPGERLPCVAMMELDR